MADPDSAPKGEVLEFLRGQVRFIGNGKVEVFGGSAEPFPPQASTALGLATGEHRERTGATVCNLALGFVVGAVEHRKVEAVHLEPAILPGDLQKGRVQDLRLRNQPVTPVAYRLNFKARFFELFDFTPNCRT